MARNLGKDHAKPSLEFVVRFFILGVAVNQTRSIGTKDSRERSADRHRVSLPARLTWKDASGAVRFVSVTTRDVSDVGVFVEADAAAAIPLYRLVHVQLERSVRDTGEVPTRLREGRVLSAIWRVAPCRSTTGTPAGYALRFLVEPQEQMGSLAAGRRHMAVAS